MSDAESDVYLDENDEPIYPFQVLEYPDPRLSMVAAEAEPGPESERMLTRMVLTVMRQKALGLASTQIGWNAAAVVVHDTVTGEVWAMLNPRITKRSPIKINSTEGCLSCPGVTAVIKRSSAVTVEGINAKGEPLRAEAKDRMAAVWQHELAHLRGRTIMDRFRG